MKRFFSILSLVSFSLLLLYAVVLVYSGGNPTKSVIDFLTVLLFVMIWFGTFTFLRLKKKKSLTCLLFFTIFYVYLYKVLDYTIFQFQSLLLLKHFMPGLMLNGVDAGKSINFIPLINLTLAELKTSLLNILLFVPFGFGLPFITNLRMKTIITFGILFSSIIELLQFVTGFVGKITFRIADSNDVIFNTTGVVIGYILFVGCLGLLQHIFRNRKSLKNPIVRYLAGRSQIDAQSRM